METPKEYYYTYYSYEEWGRGYIGSRGCKCLPEEDVKYFGSSKDKNFKPTQKIILKDDYATREEAYADEIILQQYYKVVENPHFANRSYQTSTKFFYKMTKEEWGIGNQTRKKLGLGLYGLTEDQMKEKGKKSAETRKTLGLGIFGLTSEQKRKNAKKGAEKSHKITKELGVGIYALTFEQRSKISKKNVEKLNSQKWKCLETGYVTNSGALTGYQKARGIDTSKRIRLE